MANISRVQRRDLVSIVRDFIGRETPVHVLTDVGGGVYQASHYAPHEEGYSRRVVTAHPHPDAAPGERLYYVEVYDEGRDCDGRHSSGEEIKVRPVTKRKRWYWGSVYSGRGKFEMRSRWAARTERSEQRDYNAERAGY